MEGKELLLKALAEADLTVSEEAGKTVFVAPDYQIEVEGPSLFKLLEGGYVVAPFGDAAELAAFIRRDLGA